MTESETGQPLAGALVTIEDEAVRAVTDASGRFTPAPAAPGTHTVVVSYLGRQTQRQIVAVLPVQAVALEGVTVLGMRARTHARALNQQMNAPNIVNVVAADRWAAFPTCPRRRRSSASPASPSPANQGEGRYIQIRGASPAGTQVTLNGVEVPSPEGEVRQIALDAVPVDLLDAIEVTKAILPSMDADAVGGAVNLAPSLQLVRGVRYEHTGFRSAGFDFDPDGETLTGVAENGYGNWFPMAHLRWEVAPGTNLRAAYTTAIARPTFFDLVPRRVRDDEDLAIGNPDLRPMLARNVDLLVERYDSRIGVASAGVFYKRLSIPSSASPRKTTSAARRSSRATARAAPSVAWRWRCSDSFASSPSRWTGWACTPTTPSRTATRSSPAGARCGCRGRRGTCSTPRSATSGPATASAERGRRRGGWSGPTASP